MDEKIFCAWQQCHVLEEGPTESLFGTTYKEGNEAGTPVENAEREADQLNPAVLATSNHAEDIAFVPSQVCNVDYDNKPTPENIPLPNQNQSNNQLNGGQSWECNCIDQQEITGIVDQPQKSVEVGSHEKFMTLLQWDFASTIISKLPMHLLQRRWFL